MGPPQGTASSLRRRSPAATAQAGQKENLKIPNPTDDSMKDKEKWLFGMQKRAPRNRRLRQRGWEGSPAAMR